VSKIVEGYVYFFEDFMHMRIQGTCGLASYSKQESGLTLVKEEVLSLILVGREWFCDRNRWRIMSRALKVKWCFGSC
jgi:hypothetical protein